MVGGIIILLGVGIIGIEVPNMVGIIGGVGIGIGIGSVPGIFSLMVPRVMGVRDIIIPEG